MELESLEIKNIASIAAARIDFRENPLKDESIFLICGETGAGKSTILDAVCLALYGNAPRLGGLSMERIEDDALPAGKRDQDSEITTTDPRQFLRKGTAEASATLVFKGNDGVEYTAVWSVKRGRNKADGKIQRVDWSIRWDQGFLKGKQEVRPKVEEVTGMTFDQYCRTSMLAQGEFSRFLKSNENDKAAILEKLTRTDIYARIGMRIAKKAKESRTAYQWQMEKISGIALMSDEERRTVQEELVSKEKSLSDIAREKNSAALKLRWLQTKSDLEAKVAGSRHILETAKAAVTSDSFLRDERLCQDWDATPEQRAALTRSKELEAALKLLAGESLRCRDEFAALSADLASRETELKKTVAESTVLKHGLDALRAYAPMYSAFKSINDRLQTVLSCRKTAEGLAVRLKDVEAALEKERKEYDVRKDSLARMRHARDLDQKDLDERYAAISVADKEGKTSQKVSLEVRMSQVKEAGMSVSSMQKAYARRTGETARIESYRKSCKEAEETAKAARTAFEVADRQYSETAALVERMKDSVDSWARVARTRLHPGDTCPLCGQKIENLTSDAEFEAMLAPLKEELERKTEERKSAENRRNDAIAALKAWENSIKAESEKLEKSEKEYSDARTEAEAGCALIQMSLDEKDILERLREMYKDMESRRQSLAESIDAITVSEKAARQLQESINTQNRELEAGDRKLQAASEAISSLEQEAASLQAGADAAASNAEASMSLAGKDIVIDNWQERFNADPEGFIAKLEAGSVQYSEGTEKLSAMAVSIEKAEAVIRNIRASRRSILEIFPEWEQYAGLNLTAIQWTDKDNPDRKWVDLYSRTGSVKDREKAALTDLQRIHASLEKYHEENAVSGERLEELVSMDPQKVMHLKEEVAGRRSALKTAESVLIQRMDDLGKHNSSAPELTEEDTTENLVASIARSDAELEAMNREIGSLRRQLQTDEENARAAGQEKETAGRLKEIAGKWERLSDIFGDMEGKKFKKIAQAFVMTELVRKANRYLERLSDRYILDSQPATLTLTVRDMYQGGAVRSVNTLSGGETFLVSLSLALGLSSLSNAGLKVNILFIDEGFGTLSSDYLNVVMEALENLHQMGGRKVGIISHVESLRERIPVQIQVRRQGNSASVVSVVSAG